MSDSSQHSKQIVHVSLAQRGYDIEIGTGNLAEAGPFVRGRLGGSAGVNTASQPSHVVIIADRNVEQTHARAAAESMKGAGLKVDLISVEPGETSKSVHTAEMLWQRLLDCRADRKTVIAAVGGGVIGDLAGFVAATFARGLPFVQIPTTLLADVDSSVGGKVGVNLPTAKNMVGAFWQPRGVLIDTAALATLPDREYRSGLAEVVKYGVILDAPFFEELERDAAALSARDNACLRRVIARCCRLKGEVVAADEREETGQRAVLNYGHTFAHAFETLSGYQQLLHGEAVAIGMICASRLAQRLGRVDARCTQRQQQLLAALGLSVKLPSVDPRQMLLAMSRDKKVEYGRLRFVLPTKIGHVELVGDVAEEDVSAVLSEQ